MRFLLVLFSINLGFANLSYAVDPADKILGRIPVQENGRLKPFDTFSRESLQLIYGKKSYNGKGASEIVMTWMLLPEHWDQVAFIEVNSLELKRKLKVNEKEKYFSPSDLLNEDRTSLLFAEVEGKKKAREKLNPFFQAVDRLQNQLSLYKAIVHGMVPHFVPPKEGDRWLAISEMNETFKGLFGLIGEGFVGSIKEGGSTQNLKSAVDQFISTARAENPSAYAREKRINVELFFNKFHPFQKAWIFYLLAAVMALAQFISPKPILNKISWAGAILGFVFHTMGFILRIYIAERPPVSNMYETVVWVPWASMLFAFIFHHQLRNKFLIFAASVICFICMVVADLAPIILDSSVQPLQAVLRSNMWLLIHVLTITVSYGAFFLAFLLGDVGLVLYLIGEEKKQNEILALRDTIYRALQVGVVLLAAGTILGGIWADYSWGRFWGWDPKETWAFIALLGYLAILHARLSGWLQTFGFIVGAVVAFNLVLMAWYGVNFVLGAGLHSYGFGGGGVLEVSLFVLAHLIFISIVAFVRSAPKKAV